MLSKTTSLFVAIAVILAITTTAHAVPQIYTATLDLTPGFESSFTLDFGGGFVETAFISNTEFSLEVDPDFGTSGSARFLSYYQEIDPLDLPDPMGGSNPISTGDITVEILSGTSAIGSFDPVTGAFTTGETYRVHFTGDLSAYGLLGSFVDLPSTSSGLVLMGTPTGDRIEQHWEGTFAFPGTPISLAYQCHVYTQVVPEPGFLALAVAPMAVLALLRRRQNRK